MGSPEFGMPEQGGEEAGSEARRERLARVYQELRTAVAELISSGLAQNGRAHTPELKHAEALGEQLKGEPIRGVLNGNRYYTDPKTPPNTYVSEPFYLPHGFETPTVMGIFEGAIKKGVVLENPELMIGVSPFALSDRDDITGHYSNNIHALNRWHQPLGLRNTHRDKVLWLPAVDFEFVPDHPDDDYAQTQDA